MPAQACQSKQQREQGKKQNPKHHQTKRRKKLVRAYTSLRDVRLIWKKSNDNLTLRILIIKEH